MELTTEQKNLKEAIVNTLLGIKKESYNVIVASQQRELAMAKTTNDNDGGLYESGKVDQSINRLRATSQVSDDLEKEINLLEGIMDHITPTEEIQLGDVIYTNQGNFFVAVPADEFEVEGEKFRGISTDSPLYQALAGKHDGDTVEVNGNSFTLNRSF